MKKALALILLILLPATSEILAQQTVFNVSSHDVVPFEHLYGELQIPVSLSAGGYVALAPRVVIGIGHGFEVGANEPLYLSANDPRTSRTVVAAKHVDFLGDSSWRLIEGAHGYLPLSHGRTLGLLAYFMAGKNIPGIVRGSVGLYAAMRQVTGIKNEFGVLASLEIPVHGGLALAADYYSGDHALSAISAGAVAALQNGLRLKLSYESVAEGRAESVVFAVGFSI